MDDEKLISLVEANPCLYNKRNKYYKVVDVKHNVWNEIALDMRSTNELCIRRWTTLRDRFSRECRKMLAPSESGTGNDKLWPLFERMQFLRQHIAPKPSRSSINKFEITEASASRLPSPINLDLPPSPTNSDPSRSPTNLAPLQSLTMPVEDGLPSPSLADLRDSSISPSPSTPSILRVGKKQRSDMDKAFLKAVEVFGEYANEQKAQRENQAVFGFSQMIMAKLNGMSPPKQTRTMLKMHQVLLEAEYEQ